MSSFNGPWCTDLESLKKSTRSVPSQHQSSFTGASKCVLQKVCDADCLHVWESDSDIDSLLQLTSVIAKLCNLGIRKEKGVNASDGSMLIIAEGQAGRNDYQRICHLVEYLIGACGKAHLEGTVMAFGSIVVVKGWDNAYRIDDARAEKEAEKTVKGINIAVERIFRMGKIPSGKKKIVWHHGPAVQFLLHWINNTSTALRSALIAMTITGSLNLTDGVKPSVQGRANILPDLQRLESYAKKLDIPVLFLDSESQLITSSHLATYMYYYSYYIFTLLPSALLRPHLHNAQDSLVTFAFQLLGASKHKYNDHIVSAIKQHLYAGTAKKWANQCIDARSYEKSQCRAAGNEDAIDLAVHLADSPFLRFKHHTSTSLSAFARLSVGPAAGGCMDHHTACPVDISFAQSRLRPSVPASFYIMLPTYNQDAEKITHRVQGLMMAVLERVRQGKGNPVVGREEGRMWEGVVKACTWALREAEGEGMPAKVKEKVRFVNEKIRRGAWGHAVGVLDKCGDATKGNRGMGDSGVSDAAKANARASAVYGMGHQQQQQFAQSTHPPPPMMSYTNQQPGMEYAAHQGTMASPNSPGMHVNLAMYAPNQGGGGGVSTPGFAQQQYGSGTVDYAHPGYLQSMGGPW